MATKSIRSKESRKRVPISTVPIEWMGPPAWRLPSGKALAEFALQAGFLAPLLLGDGPFWRKPTLGVERRPAQLREGKGGVH